MTQGATDGSARISAETRAVLERIEEHVIHSDFDEAETTAAEYAGTVAGQV